ncbi:hypothetical protein [Hyphococcus sp.]|uniref:hypothetical protein n=1 Tax=Hyphococcus sp. TaxID=2038636 RepID=UPI0035C6ABC8
MLEFCQGQFHQGQGGATAGLARAISAAVLEEDASVTMTAGAFMNAKSALRYHQQGVLKYALTSTVRGLSFHSMVMSSCEDAIRFARARLTGVRIRKGCFTVNAPEAFDMPGFRDFIRFNAQQDFQPVIDRYARRTNRQMSTAQ